MRVFAQLIHTHPRKLLLALCLLLYVPGLFALPPLDRDESRFVQSSRQMAESGDVVNIWFQDEPRHKKPIGIYWLQSASARFFGADWIGSYRLISLLAAIGSVLSLYHWLLRYLSSPRKRGSSGEDELDSRLPSSLLRSYDEASRGNDIAFVASALLACCLGLTLEAHQAKTDAALLLCIITMQGVLLNVWGSAEKPKWLPYLYWLALGAGVLIKGPVALLVGGLTVLALLAYDRSLAFVWKMRPISGALVSALVVLPWFYAIQQETGGAFLAEGYAADVLPKLISGVESHGAPPGYYLALLAAFFWPSIALLPAAVPVIWQKRKEPLVVFALAWLLPSWLVFELIPTKLPHYVLPTYPALALLVAYASTRSCAFAFGKSQDDKMGHSVSRDSGCAESVECPRLILLGKAIWALIALVLCAALIGFPLYLKAEIPWHAYIVAVFGLALLVLGLKRLHYAIAFQLVIFAYVFQFLLPSLDPMWVSRQLQRTVAPYANAPIALADYHEPSAVFLLGTQTKLTDSAGVAAFLKAHGEGAIGIVDESQLEVFNAAMGSDVTKLEGLDIVDGLNYAKGKRVVLFVCRMTKGEE